MMPLYSCVFKYSDNLHVHTYGSELGIVHRPYYSTCLSSPPSPIFELRLILICSFTGHAQGVL